MLKQWSDNIDNFIKVSAKHNVRMIMVGGGAVNFHGYQRHSADVDFWIDCDKSNLQNLLNAFKEMGYQINDFPKEVEKQQQNISVKFSPVDLNLELITNFSINKSFDEAYRDSEEVIINDNPILKWRVLNFDDLILSKIKANRPKDILDIQELQRIKQSKP